MSFSSRRGRDHRPVRCSSTSPPDQRVSVGRGAPPPAITRLPPRLSLPAGSRGSAPAWGRSRMPSGCGCATSARRQRYSRRSGALPEAGAAPRARRALDPRTASRAVEFYCGRNPRGNCPDPASVTPATAVPNPLRDQGRLSRLPPIPGTPQNPRDLAVRLPSTGRRGLARV
jgi:hypothetical protein